MKFIKRMWAPLAVALLMLTSVTVSVQHHSDSNQTASAVQGLSSSRIDVSMGLSSANAASMSDYWENKGLDHLFRATAYTAPSALYVALATSTGSDSACGTEVSGGSYARVSVTSGTSAWANTQASGTGASTGTGGTTSNSAAITFPAPTANWGTITEFCVFDASTSGNLLFRAALTASKTVNSGDAAPSFAIGALTFQLDN